MTDGRYSSCHGKNYSLVAGLPPAVMVGIMTGGRYSSCCHGKNYSPVAGIPPAVLGGLTTGGRYSSCCHGKNYDWWQVFLAVYLHFNGLSPPPRLSMPKVQEQTEASSFYAQSPRAD